MATHQKISIDKVWKNDFADRGFIKLASKLGINSYWEFLNFVLVFSLLAIGLKFVINFLSR